MYNNIYQSLQNTISNEPYEIETVSASNLENNITLPPRRSSINEFIDSDINKKMFEMIRHIKNVQNESFDIIHEIIKNKEIVIKINTIIDFFDSFEQAIKEINDKLLILEKHSIKSETNNCITPRKIVTPQPSPRVSTTPRNRPVIPALNLPDKLSSKLPSKKKIIKN